MASKKTTKVTQPGTPASDVYRLEYVPLPEVMRWPHNPKRHDEPGIEALIKRFGFIEPLTLDEKTKRLVAGHGRLSVLEAMKSAGDDPPKRIQLGKDGEWLVPVIRGVTFESEVEAEAYLVGVNRATENGGWDETELVEMVRRVTSSLASDAIVMGYSQTDLDDMLKSPDVGNVNPGSATQAPSLTLHFSTEKIRDAVKVRILEEAGKDSKVPTGDVLAKVLGVSGKRPRR